MLNNGKALRLEFQCVGLVVRRKSLRRSVFWLVLRPVTLQAQCSKWTAEFFSMDDTNTLKEQIKSLMVENLMLQVTAAEINDEQALFGPGSLGLDSVDALQLVVALDKTFGLKIPDPVAAKEILQSVNTIAQAVAENGRPAG